MGRIRRLPSRSGPLSGARRRGSKSLEWLEILVWGRPRLLFDIVDIGKGCAGGGPERFAGFRSYDRPVYPELKLTQKLLCIGLDLKVMSCLFVNADGWLYQLESLILAQNERWRHA